MQFVSSFRLISEKENIKVYKTNFASSLYSCENSLRGKQRLCVFENRVRRRIFGTNTGKAGGWSKLHNEELNIIGGYLTRENQGNQNPEDRQEPPHHSEKPNPRETLHQS
jgi:hypothetical protein